MHACLHQFAPISHPAIFMTDRLAVKPVPSAYSSRPIRSFITINLETKYNVAAYIKLQYLLSNILPSPLSCETRPQVNIPI